MMEKEWCFCIIFCKQQCFSHAVKQWESEARRVHAVFRVSRSFLRQTWTRAAPAAPQERLSQKHQHLHHRSDYTTSLRATHHCARGHDTAGYYNTKSKTQAYRFEFQFVIKTCPGSTSLSLKTAEVNGKSLLWQKNKSVCEFPMIWSPSRSFTHRRGGLHSQLWIWSMCFCTEYHSRHETRQMSWCRVGWLGDWVPNEIYMHTWTYFTFTHTLGSVISRVPLTGLSNTRCRWEHIYITCGTCYTHEHTHTLTASWKQRNRPELCNTAWFLANPTKNKQKNNHKQICLCPLEVIH